MIYRQSNTILKLTEAIGLSILSIILVFLFTDSLPVLNEVLWSVAIVLISMRYGLYFGLIPFFIAFLTSLAYEYQSGGDLYLYLTDLNHMLAMMLFFFLLLFTGLSSKSHKERYSDISYLYEEISEDKKLLEETLDEALSVNESYRKRFLESEDQYAEMYEMITALHFTDSDTIFNEMVRIVNQKFKGSQLVLYLISNHGDSIRSKINTNRDGKLKSNYWMAEMPSLFNKVMQETSHVLFRSPEDDPASPALAGPVFIYGEMRYLLAVDGIDLKSCTSQQIQWLDWCLKWMGTRLGFAYKYEREQNHHERYPGTGIFKLASFFKRFNAELERAEKIGQPFVIFELNTAGLSLDEIDLLMKNQLRELDTAGWDEETEILYVLLPGVEPVNETAVKARLQRALEKEVDSLR
ncbi:hypothetical protein J9317_14805 [Metabacillus sp. KIGAM252]|uniref:Sulfatase N-terminal domain-containing protein n=1 Tax=Metabacillus flavus TaxID=2823519 RepID=A0ABS5LHR7_9BACI|nr:hypothetical protein [Metabacillus flavus]MBS2970038.1 hypothetical protein [Metabacillus flavus]